MEKIAQFVFISLAMSSIAVHATQTIQKLQNITFYEGKWCTGRRYTYAQSTNFSSGSWQFKNAASANPMGAWHTSMTMYMNSSINKGEYFDEAMITNGDVTWLIFCRPLLASNDNATYYRLSLTRNGPEDMSESEIMLYSDSDFKGDIMIFVNKTTEKFTFKNSTKIAKSYIFSGIQNWTVFSDTDYQGEETCLEVSYGAALSGYGLTYRQTLMKNFTVGSVRRDCKIPIVTTTAPEATTSVASNNINIIKNFSYHLIFIVCLSNLLQN